MRTIILFFLLISAFVSGVSFAAGGSFPQVSWSSKDPYDQVIIENGNNTTIVVMITVNKVETASSAERGVTISNCGRTSYIAAGSSAICYNNNGATPVTFSSDSANPLSGVYQITQQ